MKTKTKTQTADIEQRLVKAIGHPLRIRALSILNQRVASPTQIATELGEPIQRVAYHVRTLAELDCIELVNTRPRRGATEHFYRATERPWLKREDWARVPNSLRSSIAKSVLAHGLDDLIWAADNQGFDRPDVHLSRTPIVLDEQGWTDFSELLDRTLEGVLEIQAESVGRLHSGGDTPGPTASLFMAGFEGVGPPKAP